MGGAGAGTGGDPEPRQWGWTRLPRDLRLRILLLLPLRSAVISRGVCRDWRDSLSTWSSGRKPWFLVRHEQVEQFEQEGNIRWALIDAQTGDWIRLPSPARSATSAAAGDGIVCVCVGNSVRPEFHVGNPLLLSSWRKLPELPPLKTAALARLVLTTSLLTSVLGIVSGDGVQFRVLVGRCGFILVYDSGSGKWGEVPGAVPPAVLQMLQESDERGIVPVRRGSRLLWAPVRGGGGVVGFDFEKSFWFVHEAEVFERLSSVSLTRDPSSGAVLMVGAHRSSGSHHFRHLKVWEFSEGEGEGGAEWRCLSRMKDYMLQEVSPNGFFVAHCWGSEMVLLSCTLEKFSSQLRDWGFKRLVLWSYDIAGGTWSANPLRRPLRDVEMSSAVAYPFRPSLAG